MSAGVIAVALGLLTAPELGATIAQAFDQLGDGAVFAPGCLDGSTATRAIEAPARWASPRAAARWQGVAATVMAEIDGRSVIAVHLAKPAISAANAAACRLALVNLAGAGPTSVAWDGPDLVLSRPAGRIAGAPAQYRAIFHPVRHECRTMLTIGARGEL